MTPRRGGPLRRQPVRKEEQQEEGGRRRGAGQAGAGPAHRTDHHCLGPDRDGWPSHAAGACMMLPPQPAVRIRRERVREAVNQQNTTRRASSSCSLPLLLTFAGCWLVLLGPMCGALPPICLPDPPSPSLSLLFDGDVHPPGLALPRRLGRHVVNRHLASARAVIASLRHLRELVVVPVPLSRL